MNALPAPDQPDNYTGIHNRTRIRWITLEASPHGYTGHLIPGTTDHAPRSGSYCTRFNPRRTFDLCGMKYPTRYGGYSVVPPKGEIIGSLLTDLADTLHKETPVTWCPECLTMAACEAEMIGQRAYKVKTLLGQLGKQQPQKHP